MIKRFPYDLKRIAASAVNRSKWVFHREKPHAAETHAPMHPAMRSRCIPLSPVKGIGTTIADQPVTQRPALPEPQLERIQVQSFHFPALAANG